MKFIDLLLRLYPEEFRARYEREMRAFHRDRLGEHPSWFRITRDHLRSAFVEQLRAIGPDVRYAVRGMARRPGFAAVVIATTALGVGANGAIFSVVNGVLFRPLPYRDPERILRLSHAPPQWLVSEPQFVEYKRHLRSIGSIAAYTRSEGNLSTEEPERVGLASVTREFFSTLGVPPLLGRSFGPDEMHSRPATVVLLSHRLWQRRFGGDPGILGKPINLNGIQRTVIGVMPERFAWPSPETRLWLPLCSARNCTSFEALEPDTLDGWNNHYLSVIGRIRDGASPDQVRVEASLIATRIIRQHPENFDPAVPLTPKLETIADELVGDTRPYLVALFGAVGFVLLIVCANVANLMLARGEGRRRELALRGALGASGRRLRTQVLTESIVMAIAGGVAGLALAWAGQRAILALAPASLPRLDEVRLDWAVIVFSLAVAILAGVLFAAVPAIRASREDPGEALKTSARVTGRGAAGRARRGLVVAETALAMILLTGAGMLLRSLAQLQRIDLGFRPAGVLTAKVSPNPSSYDGTRTVLLYRQLLERIRAIPGVRAAGAARWLPVVDAGGLWDVRAEGKTYPPGPMPPAAAPQEVTPGYFAAMGIPLLAGRAFTDRDHERAPLVAVVSQSFARLMWPDEEPLGKRYRLGGLDSAWVTVVGVASDILSRGFVDTPEPTMYLPHAQTSRSSYFVPGPMTLVVRNETAPASLASPIRAAVHALDPAIPVSQVRTLEAVVETSTASRRFATVLIAGFAGLAMVLGGIGIYGVISYTVSERRFEFGVRMALGADKSRVLGLVMTDGVRLAAGGMLLGLLGSLALGRLIRSLLFGVARVDLTTLLLVTALLGAVALLASLLPARRATAVNPTEALRTGA